jgi:hypothetical protein
MHVLADLESLKLFVLKVNLISLYDVMSPQEALSCVVYKEV